LSVFDPTDLRLPPALPKSAGLGTVAEKRLSSSDTSNSGALWHKDATPYKKNREMMHNRK
jgi:hypothetical protein